MEKAEFCKIVKGFIADENSDENKYREFADSLHGTIGSGSDTLVYSGTMLISNQEKTHKDFWMSVYEEYCTGMK